MCSLSSTVERVGVGLPPFSYSHTALDKCHTFMLNYAYKEREEMLNIKIDITKKRYLDLRVSSKSGKVTASAKLRKRK